MKQVQSVPTTKVSHGLHEATNCSLRSYGLQVFNDYECSGLKVIVLGVAQFIRKYNVYVTGTILRQPGSGK